MLLSNFTQIISNEIYSQFFEFILKGKLELFKRNLILKF